MPDRRLAAGLGSRPREIRSVVDVHMMELHVLPRRDVQDPAPAPPPPVIEEEAMAHGRRALGECIATGPGELRCKAVLHAVGAWREVSCIARTAQRALLLAEDRGLRTLAIPALGTGAASALRLHLILGGSRLEEVRFVLYDKETLDLFIEQVSGVFLGEEETSEEQEGARDRGRMLWRATPSCGRRPESLPPRARGAVLGGARAWRAPVLRSSGKRAKRLG